MIEMTALIFAFFYLPLPSPLSPLPPTSSCFDDISGDKLMFVIGSRIPKQLKSEKEECVQVQERAAAPRSRLLTSQPATIVCMQGWLAGWLVGTTRSLKKIFIMTNLDISNRLSTKQIRQYKKRKRAMEGIQYSKRDIQVFSLPMKKNGVSKRFLPTLAFILLLG